MQINRVTVFGGTGFLGSEVVDRLAAEDIEVRVAVRRPDRAAAERRLDDAGRVEAVYADLRDDASVARAVEGSDAAINAVGLYVERGAETFQAVHETGALNVARQAAILGVDRLVHFSGIGADPHSGSAYVRARAKGEAVVKEAFPRATILRPSVLFGPADNFLNSLVAITGRTPILPLFGRGQTALQPLYVGDAAEAAFRTLQHPAAPGETYELGGPETYRYRALIELVLKHSRQRCRLVPLPFAIWQGLATLASILPSPPITRAQVTLMRRDNVVAHGARSLEDLGIAATSLEDVLPSYPFAS